MSDAVMPMKHCVNRDTVPVKSTDGCHFLGQMVEKVCIDHTISSSQVFFVFNRKFTPNTFILVPLQFGHIR